MHEIHNLGTSIRIFFDQRGRPVVCPPGGVGKGRLSDAEVARVERLADAGDSVAIYPLGESPPPTPPPEPEPEPPPPPPVAPARVWTDDEKARAENLIATADQGRYADWRRDALSLLGEVIGGRKLDILKKLGEVAGHALRDSDS